MRGLELSVLPLDLQGEVSGWRLSSITNDVINHGCVMKPPLKKKKKKKNGIRKDSMCQAPNPMGTDSPLFETLPCVSLHLAVDLYPLICFVINS